MRTYEATVKIGGSSNKIRIDADGYYNAKKMLEAQYGEGNVKFIREVN